MAFTRQEVLARLRKSIDAGVPIIGGGAGTGISAKFEEAGGVDLIVRRPEEVERNVADGNPFYTQHILSEGEVLYERRQ